MGHFESKINVPTLFQCQIEQSKEKRFSIHLDFKMDSNVFLVVTNECNYNNLISQTPLVIVNNIFNKLQYASTIATSNNKYENKILITNL